MAPLTCASVNRVKSITSGLRKGNNRFPGALPTSLTMRSQWLEKSERVCIDEKKPRNISHPLFYSCFHFLNIGFVGNNYIQQNSPLLRAQVYELWERNVFVKLSPPLRLPPPLSVPSIPVGSVTPTPTPAALGKHYLLPLEGSRLSRVSHRWTPTLHRLESSFLHLLPQSWEPSVLVHVRTFMCFHCRGASHGVNDLSVLYPQVDGQSGDSSLGLSWIKLPQTIDKSLRNHVSIYLRT